MKGQWRLVDVETEEILATIGEPFEISELLEEEWKRQFEGTSKVKNPVGILRWKKKKLMP
jgi:hypothetical protein